MPRSANIIPDLYGERRPLALLKRHVRATRTLWQRNNFRGKLEKRPTRGLHLRGIAAMAVGHHWTNLASIPLMTLFIRR